MRAISANPNVALTIDNGTWPYKALQIRGIARVETVQGVVPEYALAAQAFTGLVLGGIYVLMAIGLSLIFGLMTVVNFAHGSFYMLGAYVAFTVMGLTKSFWAALIIFRKCPR